MHKDFSFDDVQSAYFSSICAFGVTSNKPSPDSWDWDFLISFKDLIVLALVFHPFRVSLCVCCEVRVQLYCFVLQISNCPRAICWKDYSFSHGIVSGTPAKATDQKFVDLLLGSIRFHWFLCLSLGQCYMVLIAWKLLL